MPKFKICSSCRKLIAGNETCDCKKIDTRRRVKNYSKNNPDEIKFFNSNLWKAARTSILERDLYLCQRCWSKYDRINSNELQVHHIKSRLDYPELRLDYDNLITVCKTCNLELGTTNKLDFERM